MKLANRKKYSVQCKFLGRPPSTHHSGIANPKCCLLKESKNVRCYNLVLCQISLTLTNFIKKYTKV